MYDITAYVRDDEHCLWLISPYKSWKFSLVVFFSLNPRECKIVQVEWATYNSTVLKLPVWAYNKLPFFQTDKNL